MTSPFIKKSPFEKATPFCVGAAYISTVALSLSPVIAIPSAAAIAISMKDGFFQLTAFISLGILFLLAAKYATRRRVAYAGVLGGLLALCVLLGISSQSVSGMLGDQSWGVWASLTYLGLMAGYAFIGTALFVLLFALAERVGNTAPASVPQKNKYLALLYVQTPKSFFLLCGLFMLCWLPYYIMLFPGTIEPDTGNQMQMAFGLVPATTHHPVLITWVLGLFLRFGRAVFGSYYWGIAFLCSLQYIAYAAIFSHTVLTMGKACIRPCVVIFTLCYFAFCPSIAVGSVSLLKDYWLGPMVLLLCLQLYTLLQMGRSFFLSPPRLLCFFSPLFSSLC